MALTLGPVIGTVGGATWEETPFSVVDLSRNETRVLMTVPPPPRIRWWSRWSSTSTPAHRTRETSLSGRPRPHWSRASTASSSSCHRARMFGCRRGPTRARTTGGSPASSTPSPHPADLVGGL